MMPHPPKSRKSSTDRRKELWEFIETFGDIMVRSCNNCRKAGRVCRVHVRSGKCAACIRRGCSDCDVRVTEDEFSRLRREHEKLRKDINDARAASMAAQAKAAEAQEEVNRSLSKEMRLRLQLDQLERREAEAIAVEERSIEEQEVSEGSVLPDPGSSFPGTDLALQPWTWSALEGLPDDIWEVPCPQSEVPL